MHHFKKYTLFFSLLIMPVISQFSFSPIVGFQNITCSNGIASSLIKDSGTNAYANIIDNNYYYKVVHWNLTNSSNYHIAGNYTEITQSTEYYFTYIINDFVLASGPQDRVKVYNRSTYAYIGTLNTNDVLGRGQLITSNNIFVFATMVGSIGYFNATNIPNINITYLTPSYTDFTFLDLSPDQSYFVTSSKNSNLIRFWSTSNWSLIQQETSNTAGVYGHTWSPDSRYCYSNLYNQGKIQVFDRNLNFAKIYTIITNQLNVRTTFYYPQTNILVGLSQYSKSIFTVNMNNNITTHYVYNFSNTFKMYTDQQKKSFTVNDGISTAWFFKIYPYCNSTTIYNKTTMICDSCPSNCSACNNSTFCTTCNANFNNANGVCIQCTGATYFNSTNLVCASCPSNCSTCNNSTFCTTCNLNFNNANGVCIQCTGATYFNQTNHSCASCFTNCQLCNNSNSCASCSSGYNNAGTSCVICHINQYFNLTLLSCQSCLINCASCANSSFCLNCQTNYNNVGETCILCQSNQYFNTSSQSCEVCSPNCIQCLSSSSCLVCQYNFILVNESCQLESRNDNIDEFFQYVLSVTIKNDIIKFLNFLPGSRRILKQIFGFFINLDHIWLYIYHKREYGYYVNTTLYAIKNLQDSKWNIISSKTLTNAFQLNISNLQNEFISKTNYTSWKFMQVEKNQISFFCNTLNYFFLNVPLVLAIFLLMRFLFKFFFNFEISLLFRQYSFYAYLILMLIEGNIEDFLYLFVSELFTLFSFSFIDKLSYILMIGFFFFFIFAIFSSYLIFKSAFNKLTKYFYDNCHTVISGAVYLTITNGLFNFCLGTAHRIFQDSYKFQLLSLSIIQICYMIFIVYSLKNYKIFELYYIQWANFIQSCLRILLLVTYFIDYKTPGENYVIQQMERNIIILYLIIWLLIIVLNYCYLTVKFVQYLVRKYKKLQKQDNQKYKYRNMIGYSQKGNKKVAFQYISGKPQSKSQKKPLGIKIIIDDSMSENAKKIFQKQRIKQIIQNKKNKIDQLINKINSRRKQQQNIEVNRNITIVKAKRRLYKQKNTNINGLSLLKKQEKQELFQQVWNFSRIDKEKSMNHSQYRK